MEPILVHLNGHYFVLGRLHHVSKLVVDQKLVRVRPMLKSTKLKRHYSLLETKLEIKLKFFTLLEP